MAALSLVSVPLREGLGEKTVGLFSRGQRLPSWEQKLGGKSVGRGLWGPRSVGRGCVGNCRAVYSTSPSFCSPLSPPLGAGDTQ